MLNVDWTSWTVIAQSIARTRPISLGKRVTLRLVDYISQWWWWNSCSMFLPYRTHCVNVRSILRSRSRKIKKKKNRIYRRKDRHRRYDRGKRLWLLSNRVNYLVQKWYNLYLFNLIKRISRNILQINWTVHFESEQVHFLFKNQYKLIVSSLTIFLLIYQ